MTLPAKIIKIIYDEAKKDARFVWYQGWERSSGYIKTELRGDCRFGSCRLYMPWKKKNPPTKAQIDEAVEKCIDDLCNNEQHGSTQRDFTHYVLETFYRDIQKAKNDVMLHLESNLTLLIQALENSEQFFEMQIQDFHNELKNYEQTLTDHESLSQFLSQGRKRVGA